MTRPRAGQLRNVSVIVPCRYSPATAIRPNSSVNSAARPTWASARLCSAGSCTFPPDSDQAGDAGHHDQRASGQQQPGAADAAHLAELAADRSGHRRQVQECGLQRAGRLAEFAQRPREAEPSGVDDDHVVGGLGDLAEHVAGHHDRAAFPGQAAQQPPQPGDAGRVEAVGRLVKQQHLRVAQQGGGQAQALPHAQGELADPPPRGRGQVDLAEHLVHPASGTPPAAARTRR